MLEQDRLRAKVAGIRAKVAAANQAGAASVDKKVDDAIAKFRVRKRKEVARGEQRRTAKRSSAADKQVRAVERGSAAKRRALAKASARKATSKGRRRRGRPRSK
jgi:hypothetical protein